MSIYVLCSDQIWVIYISISLSSLDIGHPGLLSSSPSWNICWSVVNYCQPTVLQNATSYSYLSLDLYLSVCVSIWIYLSACLSFCLSHFILVFTMRQSVQYLSFCTWLISFNINIFQSQSLVIGLHISLLAQKWPAVLIGCNFICLLIDMQIISCPGCCQQCCNKVRNSNFLMY